jgi:hypothetical protein
MSLLFTLAEWHALAKLRLHTDSTLDLLGNVTRELGQQARRFQAFTCSAFDTKELPKEAVRGRRRRAKRDGNQASSSATVTEKAMPKKKTLNLFTYKWHALADYVKTIQFFGTSDSYSTQPVCRILNHYFLH